jgi:FkbM family methyltransferase
MTLVLARAAGPLGLVHAFEPNPHVIPILLDNVHNWENSKLSRIQVHTCAISDRDGSGSLKFSAEYHQNQGNVSLAAATQGSIQVRRLDSFGLSNIGVMKVDVEGHEASVLLGARSLLNKKLIRDILFEEDEPYPSESHRLVLNAGYSLFRVAGSRWRPRLLSPDDQRHVSFLPTTYLATINGRRASDRFMKWGWRCLSSKIHRNVSTERQDTTTP